MGRRGAYPYVARAKRPLTVPLQGSEGASLEKATSGFEPRHFGGLQRRHSDELRRDQLEQQFDALGAEGFELTWILMNQKLHGEKDGHVVIFKRPLTD